MLKLLVPVGDSPRSLQAVRHAASLCRERADCEVVLLNIQPSLESTRLEAFHSLSKLREIEQDCALHDLAQAIDILDGAQVRYSIETKVGPIPETIAACAAERGCDRIVIPASPRDVRHALAHLFHRGTLEQLMRISSVPVTTVD